MVASITKSPIDRQSYRATSDMWIRTLGAARPGQNTTASSSTCTYFRGSQAGPAYNIQQFYLYPIRQGQHSEHPFIRSFRLHASMCLSDLWGQFPSRPSNRLSSSLKVSRLSAAHPECGGIRHRFRQSGVQRPRAERERQRVVSMRRGWTDWALHSHTVAANLMLASKISLNLAI